MRWRRWREKLREVRLNWAHRGGESEAGASLAEVAISFSVLATIMIGMMEVTMALYSYHFVSEVAREASRYAIVRGSTSCSNTPNLTNCNVTADELQSWARSLGYPGVNPNNLAVSTTWPSTGSGCYPSATPCNNPGNLVRVQVTYAFPMNIPFLSNDTINIGSTSQMVISQ